MKKVLIIFFSFIVIFGLVYAVFFNGLFNTSQEEEIEENKNTEIIENTSKLEESKIAEISLENIKKDMERKIINNTPREKQEVKEEDLKRMASSFVERFGSYSNHSNYSNIASLKIFMTKKMQDWADNFIADIKANKEADSIYYGITTKAISVEVTNFNNTLGFAELLIKTQRQKSIATMDNAISDFQDIIIKFVKENNQWKVNSAYWQ